MSLFDSVLRTLLPAAFSPALPAVERTRIEAPGPALSALEVEKTPDPVAELVSNPATSFSKRVVDDVPHLVDDDAYGQQVLRSLLGTMQGGQGSSALAQLLTSSLRSSQPPRRGERELLAAYRYMPHLRSVVGRVAASVAAVPWRVYKLPRGRGLDAPSKAKFTKQVKDGEGLKDRLSAVRKAVDVGDLKEMPDHLLSRLLEKMNPEQTGLAARKLAQVHLEVAGEAFFIRENNAAGMPVELWGVPPHWVRDTPRPGRDFFELSWNSAVVRIPADQMWWIKDLDAEDPFGRGSGIGRAVTDELDVDEFAAKHMRAWFANSAIPAMLVGVEGAADEEVEGASERWRQMNRGPGRAKRVHFHNGKLTTVRLDDKLADMDIVNVRKYEAQIVRETWNVPPEVLGHVENSNLATIEEAINILGMLVVVPRLEMWMAEINEVLARWFPDGDRLIVVYDNPIRPDMKRILEAAKTAPAVPSVNDWRMWMALPPKKGGDDLHVVNGRFEKWDEAGSPPMTAAPTPGVDDKKPATTRSLPTSKAIEGLVAKVFTVDDIEMLLATLSVDVLKEGTSRVLRDAIEDFGTSALKEAGLSASFNMFDAGVTGHLDEYAGEKITGINETTRMAIRAELVEGVAAGEGIGPLSRRIRRVFDEASSARAKLIARTEVNGSANFARWEGFVQQGNDVVPAKRWLTTIDGRERSAHRSINGQIRKLNDPFNCQGETAQHPGGFKSASLVCNCRCVVVPVLDLDDDGSAKALTTEQESSIWRSYDRSLALWEGKMADAWRVAFARQQAEVLRSLERLAA